MAVGLWRITIETELRDQLTEWRKAQQDAAEKHEQQLALAHENISCIFHFSRIGNLARAKQMCVRVEKALDQFSGKDRAALEQRFEEARETLGDMGDWKSFATEPKYVELCEAMEELVDSKKHPDKLFSDMKGLQQQWKELGNSDISDQYWPRFKQAADKVYGPCAVFFEERRVLRKTNFEQRQQYVEQMRELLEKTDWDNSPDYKIVDCLPYTVSPIILWLSKMWNTSQARNNGNNFQNLKSGYSPSWVLVYDANIELKQELIKQAEALAASAS